MKFHGFLVSMLLCPMGALCGSAENAYAPTSALESFSDGPSQEQVLLDRLLNVYQAFIQRLDSNQPISVSSLQESASIIRDFVENFYEKLEEEYILSNLEDAGSMVNQANRLRYQHQQGRLLTHYILTHATARQLQSAQGRTRLRNSLQDFVDLYRPQNSSEEQEPLLTFRSVILPKAYQSFSKTYAETARERFGNEGYARFIAVIDQIEKQLNIPEASQEAASNQKRLGEPVSAPLASDTRCPDRPCLCGTRPLCHTARIKHGPRPSNQEQPTAAQTSLPLLQRFGDSAPVALDES